MIVAGGIDVGVVAYNTLRMDGTVDVDTWLRSEADCGKGWGPDALRTVSNYLHEEFGVTWVVLSPSARNHRAIAAYRQAGSLSG